MPIKNFKVLIRFSEISFLSFIFGYIFRITFTSNKVFNFPKSTCLLLAIFLKFIFNQKENHGFVWTKTFDFSFRKKRCFLKITFSEFNLMCLLLAIFINFIFSQKEMRGFIWPKNFDFLSLQQSNKKELFLENSCS